MAEFHVELIGTCVSLHSSFEYQERLFFCAVSSHLLLFFVIFVEVQLVSGVSSSSGSYHCHQVLEERVHSIGCVSLPRQ